MINSDINFNTTLLLSKLLKMKLEILSKAGVKASRRIKKS